MMKAIFSAEWANARVVAAFLVVFSISGCGGAMSPGPLALSVSGQWEGAIDSPSDGPGTITLTLAQTGLAVSGTVRLSQGGIADVGGTLTGTLSGASTTTTMDYTVSYEYGEHCQGTFTGTFVVTNGVMTGPYSGQNCAHQFAGTARVTRNN